MNTPLISPQLASSDSEPMIVSTVSHSSQRVTQRHGHSRGQLLGTLQGLISIEAESCQWVVPATHCVWIPPNVQHSLLRSHGPFEGWSIYIKKMHVLNYLSNHTF